MNGASQPAKAQAGMTGHFRNRPWTQNLVDFIQGRKKQFGGLQNTFAIPSPRYQMGAFNSLEA
jgi:hypothetical protein